MLYYRATYIYLLSYLQYSLYREKIFFKSKEIAYIFSPYKMYSESNLISKYLINKCKWITETEKACVETLPCRVAYMYMLPISTGIAAK